MEESQQLNVPAPEASMRNISLFLRDRRRRAASPGYRRYRSRWPVILGVSFAGVMALGLTLYFQMTSGMSDVATDFFRAARARNLVAVKLYLSESMTTSDSALRNFLDSPTASHFSSAFWSNLSCVGNLGKVQGTVTQDGGLVVPMEVDLVREKSVWKIYRVGMPMPDAPRVAAPIDD
jgi:hypothetical protein